MQLPDVGFLDALHREYPVIKAAPYSFFTSLGILLFISVAIVWWLYSSRIERLKEDIELLEREVARFEKGGRPREKAYKQSALIILLEKIRSAVWHHQNEATQLQSGWRGRFDNPTWNIISNRKYENYSLEVDGNSYQNCSFKNVSFIFHGTAPFEFTGDTKLVEAPFYFILTILLYTTSIR